MFLCSLRSDQSRFYSTQSQKSESEVSLEEIYAAMRVKTHFKNGLYQINAICFKHRRVGLFGIFYILLIKVLVAVLIKKIYRMFDNLN